MPLKFKKDRIFHGTWGTSPFQSVYQPGDGLLNNIPLMPEWYLLSALFAIIGLTGFLWWPLLFAWPLFIASMIMVVVQAAISAKKNSSLQPYQKKNFKYTFLIIALHVLQPVARLYGRFKHGLTPWRKRGMGLDSIFLFVFGNHIFVYWSEKWKATEEWLMEIEQNLMANKTRVRRGKEFDTWDLQVRSGLFSEGHGLLAIEEHGGGKQLLRFRCKTYYSFAGYLLSGTLCALSVIAAVSGEVIVAATFWIMFSITVYRYVIETAGCLNSLFTAFYKLKQSDEVKIIPHAVSQKLNGKRLEYVNEPVYMEYGLKQKEVPEEISMESTR